MKDALHECRIALRGFAKMPAFAAASVLSLALGIGATTAVFSVVHALLLRPLPYTDAERLVILWNRSPGLNITQDWFSTAQYFDVKTGHRGFEEVAIAIGANNNLSGDGIDPERVGCIRTSSNLLPMFGARMAAGHLFEPDDDVPGRAGTAILSHGTWTRRFGGDAGVLGRTIRLNDQPFAIVGVLSEGFTLPREVMPTLGVAEEGEIFLPLPLAAAARGDRGHEDYNIVAKLRPGVSLASAEEEMAGITARLRRDFPDVYPPNGGLTFGILPLLEQVVGDVRRPLLVLLGAVAFVLLIACANVANLILSRSLGRERELAVRSAIGATRGRIVQLLLTESAVLAAGGAIAGVAIAFMAIHVLRVLQPADVPRLASIHVDLATLAFTTAVAAASALVAGLPPAMSAGRVDPANSLRSRGPGPRGSRLRSVIVAVELAASVVLLIGAGLLARSFVRLEQVAPGFDARGVLTFEMMMAGRQYTAADAVRGAYKRLWDELDALPGVSASGGVTSLPLSGFFAWGPVTIEGRTPPAGEKFINADQRIVGGRYFEAMRIPLLRGRLFDAGDTPDKPRVVIVDERLATDFWPGQDPIGRRLHYGDAQSKSPWMTVVGVVGRVKQYALEADSRIALYMPQSQGTGRSLFVVVKTTQPAPALGPSIVSAVRRLDPNLPVYRVRTMETVVARSLSHRRLITWLLTVFAAAALALALVGIYGVMSQRVSEDARSLAIRVALGATPESICAWVLGQAFLLTSLGAAAGVLGAFALTRVLRDLLFGISRTDAASYGTVVFFLCITALVASWIPARRAARADPIKAMNSE